MHYFAYESYYLFGSSVQCLHTQYLIQYFSLCDREKKSDSSVSHFEHVVERFTFELQSCSLRVR